MKTKCMSCGGPTKKMQAGGLPKAQDGRSLRIIRSKTQPLQEVQKVKKAGPIKTIRKAVNKITKFTTPKMKLGGTLPKARDGGVTVRDAATGKHKSGPLSCFERAQRTNKNRKYWHEGGGKTIKNIGKNILGAGALVGAGAVAYKKSTPFKNAVDELKGKLGFNKTGGIVKKY